MKPIIIINIYIPINPHSCLIITISHLWSPLLHINRPSQRPTARVAGGVGGNPDSWFGL